MGAENIVVVQLDECGVANYHVFGENVRLLIVDERSPHDRVYEYTTRADAAALRELIPDDAEIGSKNDARHAAVEHAINAYMEGKPRLTLVKEQSDGR